MLRDNVVLSPQNIAEQQLIAVPVHVQRFIEAHLALALRATPQIHQNLVLDAARRIGCQFDIFVYLEGVHRFDQPDRADRDQILHIDARVLEFFGNVHDQPQIVLDQHASCLVAARRIGRKASAFFLAVQRFRQHITAADVVNSPRPAQQPAHPDFFASLTDFPRKSLQ